MWSGSVEMQLSSEAYTVESGQVQFESDSRDASLTLRATRTENV